MSDTGLVPEYEWAEWLKVQEMGRLTELKSGEVMFKGELLFSFVNGRTDEIGKGARENKYILHACRGCETKRCNITK